MFWCINLRMGEFLPPLIASNITCDKITNEHVAHGQFPDVRCVCEQAHSRQYPCLIFLILSGVHVWKRLMFSNSALYCGKQYTKDWLDSFEDFFSKSICKFWNTSDFVADFCLHFGKTRMSCYYHMPFQTQPLSLEQSSAFPKFLKICKVDFNIKVQQFILYVYSLHK